uniref:EF-hand domain-containing protein n=1 Tax=Oryza punctata TaxID=4537 RepID=A0A0E0K4X9_ORYPU
MEWETKPERGLVFRYFDTDGDGHLSAAEIREFYGCVKVKVKDEAKKMIVAADTQDRDGFLNIEELRAVMEDEDSEALQAVFEENDEDGDGVVTAEELQRAMHRLGGVWAKE